MRQLSSKERRSGVITLEVIIWLPVVLIFLAAIIEFSILYQVNHQVEYASRFGAKRASEIPRTTLDTYAAALKADIDTYLANHGLAASCQVILEHNACVPNPLQIAGGPCNCGPSGGLPAGEPPAGEAYVRVTVCTEVANDVPDLLNSFGFPLGTRTFEHSTTFRIETNNTTALPNINIDAFSGAGVSDGTGAIAPGAPTTNTDSTISITDDNMVPPGPAASGSVTIDLTGNATDPEDGPLTGGDLNWSIVGPGGAALSGTVGGGPITMTVNVPPNGQFRIYQLRLTSTDSCNQNRTRTINVRINN